MEVSASASDATPGLASLEYALDGGGWEAYTAPLTLGDGVHTAAFRAVDEAGNVSEANQDVKVDTLAPVIDLPRAWGLGRSVTYKVEDEGSGLGEVRVVIEDEDERWAKVVVKEHPGGSKFEGEIAWDGRWADGSPALPGEYYAWVKASDVAGNEGLRYGRVTVAGAEVPLAATSTPTAMPTPTGMATAPAAVRSLP